MLNGTFALLHVLVKMAGGRVSPGDSLEITFRISVPRLSWVQCEGDSIKTAVAGFYCICN
jgi:hypothetical protein